MAVSHPSYDIDIDIQVQYTGKDPKAADSEIGAFVGSVRDTLQGMIEQHPNVRLIFDPNAFRITVASDYT